MCKNITITFSTLWQKCWITTIIRKVNKAKCYLWISCFPHKKGLYIHCNTKYAAYHNTQLKETDLLENEGIFLVVEDDRECNTIIYSCLCGSHQESVQEGKGGIRYQIRQCSVSACQSLGNLVTMFFFKVFECQVGMSARFDPHTLGLGI